jgi:hypothetical protein
MLVKNTNMGSEKLVKNANMGRCGCVVNVL